MIIDKCFVAKKFMLLDTKQAMSQVNNRGRMTQLWPVLTKGNKICIAMPINDEGVFIAKETNNVTFYYVPHLNKELSVLLYK